MDTGLKILYHTIPGRALLRVLSGRTLSALGGKLLDSPLSLPLIRPFVKYNGIELSECDTCEFHCFNDCFTRTLKKELRPIDPDGSHLIAPCDGLLSVWRIQKDTVLPVKQSMYTVSALLRDSQLAEQFYDGICLVFRLCVNHYHRYCYIDDGFKGETIFLPGKLHTVRPIALRQIPVFTENCREYTLIDTAHFGRIAQIEVGAMLVGKIKNLHGTGAVRRGDEKGYFLYGGSTIIVLLRKDCAVIDGAILETSERGQETPVLMGQRIGCAPRTD